MRAAFLRFCSAAVAAIPCAALADGPAGGAELLKPPVGLSSLLNVVGSLVVVLGAILLTGFVYSRARGMSRGSSKLIRVLAAQPLGPKERIALVQIGDKQMAVGIAPGSINTLHVFDEQIIGSAENSERSPFAEKLGRAVAGFISK